VSNWPVPPRPPEGLERLAMGLFLALSPRLPRIEQPETPERLAPFENVTVPRRRGQGALTATWFPAAGPPRGAVLLLHPWLVWGRAYFNVRGRIEALRAAGYHALTLDFAGFGGSGRPSGFFDWNVEAGLRFLRQRTGGLPLHVWGVSAGGYWAHPVLSRTRLVSGAMFEDVAPHLLEWSWRTAPWGRPFYLFFRTAFRSAYRFLDIRRHATSMSLGAVTYVSSELDRGVRPEDTLALAGFARARHQIIPGAGHLGSIKVAGDEVIGLALETFRRAEEGRSGAVLDGLEDRAGEIDPSQIPAGHLAQQVLVL
jgi:pimeloyl-ACP methyl ester carboxylesterase